MNNDVRILWVESKPLALVLRMSMCKTYNCDLAAEVVLDLARLDGIGGVLRDHLEQAWQAVSREA